MYRSNSPYVHKTIKRMKGYGFKFDPVASGEIESLGRDVVDGYDQEGEGLLDSVGRAVVGTTKLVKQVAKEGVKIASKQGVNMVKQSLQKQAQRSQHGDQEGGFIFAAPTAFLVKKKLHEQMRRKGSGNQEGGFFPFIAAAIGGIVAAVKAAGVVGVAVGVAKAAALGAAGAVGAKAANAIVGKGIDEQAADIVKDIPVKDIIAQLTKPQLEKVKSLARMLMQQGDKAIDTVATQALPIVSKGIEKAIESKRVAAGNGLKRSGEGLSRAGDGMSMERNTVGSDLKKEMLKHHGV